MRDCKNTVEVELFSIHSDENIAKRADDLQEKFEKVLDGFSILLRLNVLQNIKLLEILKSASKCFSRLK